MEVMDLEAPRVDAASLNAWLDGLRERRGSVLIPVRAQPGARREGVAGLHDGALRIATSAPADRGRATARIGKLLADVLQLPPSAVSCVAGAAARLKTYAAEDIALDVARTRLREQLS